MTPPHDPTANDVLGPGIRERLAELHAVSSELAEATTLAAIADVVSRRGGPLLRADALSLALGDGTGEARAAEDALSIPLRIGGRVAGVLALRRSDTRWDDDDRCFADLLASATASALERARAEHGLRAERREAAARLARLRVHLDRSPLGTVELDPAGRVTAFSAGAERLFGRRAEDVVGRSVRELAWLDPDGSLGAGAPDPSAEASAIHVSRHPRGEGELVCEWYVSRLLDDAAAVDTVLALALDVSERATASRVVADADRRAHELVDVIGHELRNPLAAIGAAIAVLEHAASPDGSRHEARARAIIAGQTRHLAAMIDDLVDVARAQRRELTFEGEPVDFAQLVRQAADARRVDAQLAEIQLVVRGTDAAVPGIGMPVRLARALGALIDNAIRFGRRGGWLEVELRTGGGRIAIAVRDDGIGMEPELLARAFDPLVQGVALRERGPINGLGLGLTIARETARLHGGEIAARSDGPGKGTVVELRLPRDGAAARGPREAPSGRRVLVVDDGEDTLEMMQALLGAWGHDVRVANTGVLALEIARRHRPELVLCDLGLPGELDGYDVARALRADPLVGAARLIALTGYDGDDARARAQAAGFDELVAKPAHPDRLRALLAGLDPERAIDSL